MHNANVGAASVVTLERRDGVCIGCFGALLGHCHMKLKREPERNRFRSKGIKLTRSGPLTR